MSKITPEIAGVDLEKLRAPFPPQALRQRDGGQGKTFTYVSVDTVIRRLNSACDSWDWKVTKDQIIGEGTTRLCIVYGELTIPGLGTRTGVGVQKISDKGGEDLWKGASGDGLKKAATLFGVALELYGQDIEGLMEMTDAKDAFARAGARFFPKKVLNANGEYIGPVLDSLFRKVTGLDPETATADEFQEAAEIGIREYILRLKAEQEAKQDQSAPAASGTLIPADEVPVATGAPGNDGTTAGGKAVKPR